jgi:beta-phosphoglucomutase-like phosphatase (HAD superfamily)
LHAIQTLRIKFSDCLFFDDLGPNVRAAEALGMQTVRVTSERQLLQQLEAIVGIRSDAKWQSRL